MKTVKILASSVLALASFATAGAFAQSYSPTLPGVPTTYERANAIQGPTGGEKSRAEVRSELASAQANGSLKNPSERLLFNFSVSPSEKSRAAVRAEVIQAKSSGAMALPGTVRTPFGTTNPSFNRSAREETAGR